MTIHTNQLKKYMNPVFIETGTYTGLGVGKALAAGFGKIISIEFSLYLYTEAVKLYETDRNVFLLLGDSSVVLSGLLPAIQAPITFWLDAHNLDFAPDVSAKKGLNEFPLPLELSCIGKLCKQKHVILIDDVNIFSLYGFSVDKAKELLLNLNSRYVFSFIDGWSGQVRVNNDILVCEVK